MNWLIEQSVLDTLIAAEKSDFLPTASQRDEFFSSSPNLITNVGKVAQIDVSGVLTYKRDMFSMFFGGGNTTYSDVIQAIKSADEDSNIERIELIIDSPGGQIDGLFEAMDAIQKTSKHVRAIVKKATSAAYGIAAQANEIVAYNKASSVGSIGIVVDTRIQSNVVTITSSNAPYKRPDVNTDVGKAIVRSELDDIENLFIEAIALGRDIRTTTVISDFGKGAVFLASEAMRRGMVDSIGIDSPVKEVVANAQIKPTVQQANTMNITQLKADHPDVYDAVFALGKASGLTDGIETERKRVSAHLKLGNKFNALALAVKACEEGTDLNDPLAIADYMSAMADARDLAAAQADSASVTVDVDSVETDKPETKDKAAVDNILKFAAEKLGLELKGGAAHG